MLRKLTIPSLTLALLALLSFLTLTHAQNNTITGCVNKQGVLRLLGFGGPAQCKHPERAISWNTGGAPGPQGAKGDPGAQGVPGEQGEQGPPGAALHLYDAAGQDLGVVVDVGERGVNFLVFVPEIDAFLTFSNSSPLAGASTFGSLLYEQLFCAGPPFVGTGGFPHGGALVNAQMFVANGPTYDSRPWFRQSSTSADMPHPTTFRSSFRPDEGCLSRIGTDPHPVSDAVFVEPATPSHFPFTEPVTLPLRVRLVSPP